MNILQRIFRDYYEIIEYTLHPRYVVMESISKMINCGDPSYGGAMYGCPHCGELKFVPFRCRSKFCPSCDSKYSIDRSTKMSFKLINCTHRHLVFTIDEELRHFFLEDRSLLDCLFQAVRGVILEMFHKLNKSRNFVPGFACTLHTFGRPLEWNPHIHCVLTEGGFSDDGFWRNVKYFNYTYLRKAFQAALLNEMEKRIGPSFKKTKALIYKKTRTAFMSMPSRTSATRIPLRNTSAATSGVLSLPSRASTLMTAKTSPSITTGTKTTPMWRRPSRL